MKRKRFTEEQIIGILKERELGAKTADLCRKNGIREAKSKFGARNTHLSMLLKRRDFADWDVIPWGTHGFCRARSAID